MIKFSHYLLEKDDRVDVIDLVKKNTKIISNWSSIPKDIQDLLLSSERWDMLSSREFVAYNDRKVIYVAPYNGPDRGKLEIELKYGEVRESVAKYAGHKITAENWKKLKETMKKAGMKSWAFEGDYEVLVIGFADEKIALKNTRKYSDLIGYFGYSFGNEGTTIVVELYKDAMLFSNESIDKSKIIRNVENLLDKELKIVYQYVKFLDDKSYEIALSNAKDMKKLVNYFENEVLLPVKYEIEEDVFLIVHTR